MIANIYATDIFSIVFYTLVGTILGISIILLVSVVSQG